MLYRRRLQLPPLQQQLLGVQVCSSFTDTRRESVHTASLYDGLHFSGVSERISGAAGINLSLLEPQGQLMDVASFSIWNTERFMTAIWRCHKLEHIMQFRMLLTCIT